MTRTAGAITSLVVSATVNVEAAGSYRFLAGLVGVGGATIEGQASATLTAGTQQLSIAFVAQDLLTLGNGPYLRQNAVLLRNDVVGTTTVDIREDAGATAAISLASIDKGPLYFTGTNSATGVVTNGGAAFDVLRVQLGIVNLAATCNWNATLADASGQTIDFVSGSDVLLGGSNTLTLDFNGNLIAQSGQSGLFSVRDVVVELSLQ